MNTQTILQNLIWTTLWLKGVLEIPIKCWSLWSFYIKDKQV